eukprot:s269_g22.t1
MNAPLRYLEINLEILRCFVSGMMSLQKLPHELWYSSETRSIKVPVKVCQEYEAKVESLAERIRQRSPPERRLISTHSLLVAQRVLWICTAAVSDNLGLFLLVGSLQFMVAPYSFAASILMYVMNTCVHCLGHFCSALVIHFLPLPAWNVEINNQFIILFLGLDFLVTAYFALVANTDGYPKQFPLLKTLHHMVYGTFNGKGYLVLLLLMCKGRSFNLAWILLDALLGISPLVNNFLQESILAWESMFYHIHRMQHLPVVYEHAHRTHHHLTDGTAWDAHLFTGAGFPEDFFFLLQDILVLRVVGLPVPWMTYRLLKHQLANKDAHQRREAPYEHDEFHQDHHLHHRQLRLQPTDVGLGLWNLQAHAERVDRCQQSAISRIVEAKPCSLANGPGEAFLELRNHLDLAQEAALRSCPVLAAAVAEGASRAERGGLEKLDAHEKGCDSGDVTDVPSPCWTFRMARRYGVWMRLVDLKISQISPVLVELEFRNAEKSLLETDSD